MSSILVLRTGPLLCIILYSNRRAHRFKRYAYILNGGLVAFDRGGHDFSNALVIIFGDGGLDIID